MNSLIARCIAEIKNKSEKIDLEGYDAQAPENSAIIVNYNLDHKILERYSDFLQQLWPNVYANIPMADQESDFEKIDNQLRSNEVYAHFNQIQIHLLINLTKCDIEDLNAFLLKRFSHPQYTIILHEFLDYQNKAQIKGTEENLVDLMKDRGIVRYQFVYSNRLNNGAMWLGENAVKIMRLAANITAIMSIDAHFLNDNDVYTFSYNLLEKPTGKIVQFSIRRLLENACKCSDYENLDQDISKKFKRYLTREVHAVTAQWVFNEQDFKYLPDNDKLKKEKADVKKNIETLECHYPVTAMCFKAMVNQRISRMNHMPVNHVDFSNVLSDPLLSFDAVKGFLKEKRNKNELLESLERDLLHGRAAADEGTYCKVLAEYANQAIENENSKKILADFSEQFMARVDHACDVYEWLFEYLKSPELQMDSFQSEHNLIRYYGKLIDDYFVNHKKDIIACLNACGSKEEMIEQSLYEVLGHMFERIPIYYKSYEDEIDERVGHDTAKTMFEKISEEDNVIKNTCIDWSSLRFVLNRVKTNDVLLLINPKSKLLKLPIADHYEALKFSRQDCVERIDFHALFLKQEVK